MNFKVNLFFHLYERTHPASLMENSINFFFFFKPSLYEVRTIIIWTNTTMTNIARKKYHQDKYDKYRNDKHDQDKYDQHKYYKDRYPQDNCLLICCCQISAVLYIKIGVTNVDTWDLLLTLNTLYTSQRYHSKQKTSLG